jgi:hypothetical protein
MTGMSIIDWLAAGLVLRIYLSRRRRPPALDSARKSDMNNERHQATVANLFDLLLAPVNHGELEVAELLGVGVEPLRDRMKDLRRRGLLAGPFRDPTGVNWKLSFFTGAELRAAARRSGLNPDASVTLRDSFWSGLGHETMRVATAVSSRVSRWKCQVNTLFKMVLS